MIPAFIIARLRSLLVPELADLRQQLDQARRLKSAAGPTGQAARDALIMALLLDHRLRVGELAALTVEALDLDQGLMTF